MKPNSRVVLVTIPVRFWPGIADYPFIRRGFGGPGLSRIRQIAAICGSLYGMLLTVKRHAPVMRAVVRVL